MVIWTDLGLVLGDLRQKVPNNPATRSKPSQHDHCLGTAGPRYSHFMASWKQMPHNSYEVSLRYSNSNCACSSVIWYSNLVVKGPPTEHDNKCSPACGPGLRILIPLRWSQARSTLVLVMCCWFRLLTWFPWIAGLSLTTESSDS